MFVKKYFWRNKVSINHLNVKKLQKLQIFSQQKLHDLYVSMNRNVKNWSSCWNLSIFLISFWLFQIPELSDFPCKTLQFAALDFKCLTTRGSRKWSIRFFSVTGVCKFLTFLGVRKSSSDYFIVWEWRLVDCQLIWSENLPTEIEPDY